MPFVASGTFAEACYDQNSVTELTEALRGPADREDMRQWGLSACEWREQIELALAAKLADA